MFTRYEAIFHYRAAILHKMRLLCKVHYLKQMDIINATFKLLQNILHRRLYLAYLFRIDIYLTTSAI